MSIKPILFNTEMVRDILDGRKTVTRRAIKQQPKSKLCYTFAGSDCGTWGYPSKTAHEFWGEEFELPDDITEEELKKKWNPPYHTDDILYVRETWNIANMWSEGNKVTFIYRGDKSEEDSARTISVSDDAFDKYGEMMYSNGPEWRPSIHMPKEAARIFLHVTNVRVERLHDAKYFDFIHEGLPYKQYEREIREDFQLLWNSTIKKSDLDRYGWDANPWVWVIEFEVIQADE